MFYWWKNWKSFIFQFERNSEKYSWSAAKKLEKLVDHLADQALEYVIELRLNTDYETLKKGLTERFGTKDPPSSFRRELQSVKQTDGETLAEFGQEIIFLVMEGHPQARKETIEEIAVETFFKGCKNRAAVEINMLKDPERIADAVKMVRKAISNRKITSGKSYWSKAVSFVEDDSDLPQVRLARPVYPHQRRDRSYSPQRRYPGVNSTFFKHAFPIP